jgi:hypothetical protein
MTGTDPVKTGLVDSFGRPGGNLTGIFVLLSKLGTKRAANKLHSFDDIVSERQERLRDRQSERLNGFPIDDQL